MTINFTMRLELVPVPVSDIDASKAFYTEKLGFEADHDMAPSEGMRIVQLTPPGSACSILIGTGMPELTDRTPGDIKGLHLVVEDIASARATFVERGVTMGEIDDMGGIKYSAFADPDGNTWTLQEISVQT